MSLSELISHSANATKWTVDITVVIPTCNGGDRFPKVLEALQSQTYTQSFTWEVIVCDNNSIDDTALTIKQHQQNWSLDSPLRYCFAAEQGAAFARQRAVDVAKGDLIAFLDDDNIPALDWLDSAYTFAQTNPRAGAFGSQIHGLFDGPIPDGFEQISCFLAITERGSNPHLYHPKAKMLPPAAGLVVRRSVWLEVVPERLFLNNKGKDAGLASEDLETLLYIQKAGWDIWYNPGMVVTHLIPNSRLKKDYLVKLFRCVGLSRSYIRLLGAKNWQLPFLVPAYIANDLRKLALHYLQNRQNLDLIQSCWREHLLSTVVSPLFLIKKAYQDWQQKQSDRIRFPERRIWLNRLTEAFEQDQFQLYQQRIEATDVWDGSDSHPQYELLLRLTQKIPNAPGHTLIAPGQFLSIAERYNLARTLDRWVIRHFFRRITSVSLELPFHENLLPTDQYLKNYPVFSINLSVSSVRDDRLAEFIASQLAKYAFPPHLVCFEIREVTALAYPHETMILVDALHSLGCQVAIDDASLKLASTTVFQSLSIDYLKLSHRLISRPVQDRSTFGKIERLVKQAHDCGVETVAKGVESSALLSYTKQVGVHYVQGYQLSKPSPFKGSYLFANYAIETQ